MSAPRRSRPVASAGRCGIVGLTLVFLLSACASTPPRVTGDLADAVIPRPAIQVRDAMVEILTHDGYAVDIVEADSIRLSTGFRRTSESPWEWLLNARFGVLRQQAEARITELTETSSKLTIRIEPQSKATLWSGWTADEGPLPQRAGNYVRLIRNYLRIL